MNTFDNKDSGFTVIELLTVMAIIGLLSALAIVAVNGAREKARIAKAQEDVRSIHKTIAMLEIDTGEWPDHKNAFEDECGVSDNEICGDGCTYSITDCESGITCDDGYFLSWRGPYMENIPLDPWGNEYFFDTDYTTGGNCEAVVGSYGPNGIGNNLYDADDVIFIVPTE